MNIFIPLELSEYVRLSGGKVILIKELPEELRQNYEDFCKSFSETLAEKEEELKNILNEGE